MLTSKFSYITFRINQDYGLDLIAEILKQCPVLWCKIKWIQYKIWNVVFHKFNYAICKKIPSS